MYKFEKIAADLRKQIKNGVYGPGEKLPSEKKLAETAEVSDGTVKRALSLLASESILSSTPRSGWTVRKSEPEHLVIRPMTESAPRQSGDRYVEGWAGQIQDEGRTPSQSIEVAVVSASKTIADRLEVQVGEPVALRKRVRYINHDPINLDDSYYPMKIAVGTPILDPSNVPEGITHALDQYGWKQTNFSSEITIGLASDEERVRLGISPGTPVGRLIVVATDRDGTPIRCTVKTLPADRHTIVHEWRI